MDHKPELNTSWKHVVDEHYMLKHSESHVTSRDLRLNLGNSYLAPVWHRSVSGALFRSASAVEFTAHAIRQHPCVIPRLRVFHVGVAAMLCVAWPCAGKSQA